MSHKSMTTTHPATHPPETHIPASQHKLVVDVPPASAELLPATGCHVPARTPRKHPITRTHSGDSPSRWGLGGWRGAAGGDTEGEPTRPTATLPTLSVRLHHRSHEMPPQPHRPQHTHPHPTSLPPTHQNVIRFQEHWAHKRGHVLPLSPSAKITQQFVKQ